MTTRTLTSMFRTREDADRAAQMLVQELHIDRAMVRTSPTAGATDAGYDASRSYEDKGFFGSLKDLFLPDEDRYGYAEGMRRGHVLLTAQVNETDVHRGSDILEHAGALDLDSEEASWRQGGWAGYDATQHQGTSATGMTGMTGAAATGMAATAATTSATTARGMDETIKVVEERLVVGKRDVEHGRVRVRSYIVERPVEESVTLHEERVTLERRPVDRVATAADLAALGERTIEATATSEEAVVGKEARVVEEIGLNKQASDRTETVRDTVRKTEVEVEDGTRTGMHGTTAGMTGTTGAMGTTGTGVAGSIDRTLNTNVSGTNSSANAPDGTPGNPAGTMASRAVDKTLGTNISGANPDRK